MSSIRVQCPSCQKRGEISISSDVIAGVSSGLVAVNIPDGTICDHTFIAYIDRNQKIRDYFMADFKVEIPKIYKFEQIPQKGIPSKDIINLDLIKLNLSASLLTYILKSIFSNQKLFLINDQDFLSNHIHNFLDYITQDAFVVNLEIIDSQDYKKNKKKYKDHMVFDGNVIINNSKNQIKIKKLKVERQIIHSFIIEPDLSYSYILFKNEIHKAHMLAKSISDYVDDTKVEQLTLKIIVDFLNDKFKIKIGKTYLNFIIDIVKSYFNVEVQEEHSIEDFLEFT